MVFVSDFKENIKFDEIVVEIINDGFMEFERMDCGVWSFFCRSKNFRDNDLVIKYVLVVDVCLFWIVMIILKYVLVEDVLVG